MLENLDKYHVLLGSKSPRRSELLSQLGIDFSYASMVEVEEVYPATLPADQVPGFLACLKADAMLPSLGERDMLITADTVVVLDGKIFGKPADAADAERMLRALSGRTHQVYTGVAITTPTDRRCFTARTDVTFAEISDEDIHYYISTYHPLDKAGAYGIQEWIGGVAVESIHGSYYNVMGLPIHLLYRELLKY